MEEKRKLILSITLGVAGVLVFFGAIFGLSYAYFTASIDGNQNASSIEVDTARLATVQFTDSALINIENMLPGTSVTKTFSVSMNGENTLDMSYKVFMYWKNSGITDMVYTLTGGGTPGAIKAINTVQEEYKKDEIAEGTFSANTAATHNYTLILTFRETGENQNSQQGKTFMAYLQVEFAVGGTRVCYNNENLDGYDCTPAPPWSDSCIVGSNALNCSILANSPEYTTQTIEDASMFDKIAVSQAEYDSLPSTSTFLSYKDFDTIGKDYALVQSGLWTENRAGKTEDDLPVYFFRGPVQNNYVSFADKMWRIVRINEDGSIKLILGGNSATDGYGGTATTTTYFNGNTGVAYDIVNPEYSSLKGSNEEWYTNDLEGNLDEYEDYIADTKFCSDKSFGIISPDFYKYGAYTRIAGIDENGYAILQKKPQYKCPNNSDNLIYKIGALTADEVSYAGGVTKANNMSYYLYDNAQTNGLEGSWWLISPLSSRDDTNGIFCVVTDGASSLQYAPDGYSLNFRPVISLKSDTRVLEGYGTFAHPYVITE